MLVINTYSEELTVSTHNKRLSETSS